MRTGTPLWVTRGDDVAGVGDAFAQPYDLVGDPDANTNGKLSNGAAVDQNFWFNPAAFRRPANGTFGNAGRNPEGVVGPSFQSWDIAVFKNVPMGGSRRLQLRLEAFNFINHPNLGDPNAGNGGVIIDPGSADFGRVLTKTSERNVQLGVKFSF